MKSYWISSLGKKVYVIKQIYNESPCWWQGQQEEYTSGIANH